VSWVNRLDQPNAPHGGSLGVLPLGPGRPALFKANPEATAADLLEWADTALTVVEDALKHGVQDGIGQDESWALNTIVCMIQGAVRSAVGQP
jgi:hypothetical protein